jgi:hypothetical protein
LPSRIERVGLVLPSTAGVGGWPLIRSGARDNPLGVRAAGELNARLARWRKENTAAR